MGTSHSLNNQYYQQHKIPTAKMRKKKSTPHSQTKVSSRNTVHIYYPDDYGQDHTHDNVKPDPVYIDKKYSNTNTTTSTNDISTSNNQINQVNKVRIQKGVQQAYGLVKQNNPYYEAPILVNKGNKRRVYDEVIKEQLLEESLKKPIQQIISQKQIQKYGKQVPSTRQSIQIPTIVISPPKNTKQSNHIAQNQPKIKQITRIRSQTNLSNPPSQPNLSKYAIKNYIPQPSKYQHQATQNNNSQYIPKTIYTYKTTQNYCSPYGNEHGSIY